MFHCHILGQTPVKLSDKVTPHEKSSLEPTIFHQRNSCIVKRNTVTYQYENEKQRVIKRGNNINDQLRIT